jgi:glycosyltransferase involved in cell wall biosynthesis
VLYDFLYCRGGAERVTLELVRGLGADLCVGFRDADHFPSAALDGMGLRDLHIPLRFDGGLQLAGLSRFRHRTAFANDYDWAVFSGYLAPEAVHHRRSGGNLYYCHTVPRFAYDLRGRYRAGLPRWLRPVFDGFAGHVRSRYAAAIARMDVLVANSQNVRARLQRFLGLDARVVHPPCEVEAYRWRGSGGYYLSTARLEPYKRVDRVIDAFRRLPRERLVVASGGSALSALRRRAAGAANITFTGWISEAHYRRLLGEATATLYLARDEDFGLSPVESMAAGKPVIGVAEGGLLETIVHGRTGLLLSAEPACEEIIAAVARLTPARAAAMRPDCEARAARFSRARFLEHIRSLLAELPRC